MRAAKGWPLDSDEGLLTGRRLGRDDLGSPVAVMRANAIDLNATTMADFCAAAGVLLMPHAKTSMSPQLLELQRQHGAVGMTAAVPWQAAQLWEWGIDDVLVANEITDLDSLTALFARRTGGRRLRFYVDSPEGLAIASEAAERLDENPANVLIELGYPGGRTGVRDPAAALALAKRVAADPWLDLVGVAGYEGTIGAGRTPESLALVERYVRALGDLAVSCARSGVFARTPAGPPIITAGGSVYFDVVADGLRTAASMTGADIVLRSGCYLTHDHGVYERDSPSVQSGWDRQRFLPAIEVWGHVVSRPEPELLFVNAGRRDVSFDAGLPRPVGWFDRNGTRQSSDGWRVTNLGDQHAFVRVPASARIAPGDLLGLGISHPCTTFDKWQVFHLLDDSDRVLGAITTHFDGSMR